MRTKKQSYSPSERRAYYIGVGAAIATKKNIGKAMKGMPVKEKQSFQNGFDETLLNKPKGYFNRK